MVEFHGKPFLEYIVEMLRDQGVDKVLLLLGYLPDVIHRPLRRRQPPRRRDRVLGHRARRPHGAPPAGGPGTGRGQRSCCSTATTTGRCASTTCGGVRRVRRRCADHRVREPRRLLPQQREGRPDGTGRGVRPEPDDAGARGRGDRLRHPPQPLLELLPEQPELVEEALYPRSPPRAGCGAYGTEHRYYSVGTLERLPLTETFLARRPTVILDRDGVVQPAPRRVREYVGPARGARVAARVAPGAAAG